MKRIRTVKTLADFLATQKRRRKLEQQAKELKAIESRLKNKIFDSMKDQDRCICSDHLLEKIKRETDQHVVQSYYYYELKVRDL